MEKTVARRAMTELTPISGFTDFVPSDIFRVIFDSDGLRIEVTENGDVGVLFGGVAGFRLLDEGDLQEFWQLQPPQAWLYAITCSGWFDLESTRSGFVRERYSEAREFLVATENDCMNIFSFDQPIRFGRSALWE